MLQKPKIGQRFTKKLSLSKASIKAFAKVAGDTNPIHCDEAFVAHTSFGRVIASGAQTSSLLMSATAEYFSKLSPMLGLEFTMKFKRPVFANESLVIEWLVVQVKESVKLNGSLVKLYGRMLNAKGKTVVGAKGSVLLKSAL